MNAILFMHQTKQCIKIRPKNNLYITNITCIANTSVTNTLQLTLFLYTLPNDPLKNNKE